MAGRYWREAATLLVVGRNSANKLKNGLSKESKGNKIITDYNILFLKRSSKSSFMPESYVFPGGALDEADMDPKWLNLFDEWGYSRDYLMKKFRLPGNRLDIYTNKPSENVLPELALRICALRETFEETGLLLASSTQESDPSFAEIFSLEKQELKEWRKRVHNDGSEFIKLMEHINGIPSVVSLNEWVMWLTPTNFKGMKNRFDTAFYITFVDSEIPLLKHDKNEAEALEVESPPQILRNYYDEEILLFPPQIYELSRLLNMPAFDDLKRFSERRSVRGMERIFPVFITASDGAFTALAGDSLYPENPDFYGEQDYPSVNQTLIGARCAVSHLNRSEFSPSNRAQLVITDNIKQLCGHLSPLSTQQILERC